MKGVLTEFKAAVVGALLGAASLMISGCSTPIAAPAIVNSESPAEIRSFTQARQTVRAIIETAATGVYLPGQFLSGKRNRLQSRITHRELWVADEGGIHLASVEWRGLRPVTAGKFAGSYYVSDTGSGVNPGLIGARFHAYLNSERAAVRLAGAVNWLIEQADGAHASRKAKSFEEFRAQAQTWHQSALKPPLPEAAVRQRTLAEQALAKKDYESALIHYQAGLASAPLWPEGHYNAALLGAELESYPDAIEHMRRYLELTPDAPDAASAREKLVLWEERVR